MKYGSVLDVNCVMISIHRNTNKTIYDRIYLSLSIIEIWRVLSIILWHYA